MSFLMSKRSRPETRCVQLAPGRSVRDVSHACRSAALAFAWCAKAWQKRDLARWLTGPYANAIAVTNGISITTTKRFVGGPRARIDDDSIRSLLDRSHQQLLSLLRSVQAWKGEAGFAKSMVDAGLVIGVIDYDDSSLGFAPVSVPEMRLVDRVRSLFIADYLTSPSDYASFRVCTACEGATFDADHGDCQRSVLELSADDADNEERCITLVGLGENAA
jgi:hypothetical protein